MIFHSSFIILLIVIGLYEFSSPLCIDLVLWVCFHVGKKGKGKGSEVNERIKSVILQIGRKQTFEEFNKVILPIS